MSIEVSGDEAGAKKFFGEKGITFAGLKGDWDMARKLYGVQGTPANFLIDARGRVVFSHTGFNPKSGPALLAAEVEALLPRP